MRSFCQLVPKLTAASPCRRRRDAQALCDGLEPVSGHAHGEQDLVSLGQIKSRSLVPVRAPTICLAMIYSNSYLCPTLTMRAREPYVDRSHLVFAHAKDCRERCWMRCQGITRAHGGRLSCAGLCIPLRLIVACPTSSSQCHENKDITRSHTNTIAPLGEEG